MKRITLSAKNRALLFRALMMAAAFLVLALLETSFLPHFPFFGTVPDLVLVLIVVAARETNEKFGGTVGLLGGIIVYMMGDVGIALWILFYAACGYLVGLLSGKLLGKNYLSYCIFCVAAAFLKLIYATVLCGALSAAPQIFRALWQSFLPEFLITAIAGALLYVPFRAFVRRTEKKEAA